VFDETRFPALVTFVEAPRKIPFSLFVTLLAVMVTSVEA